MGSKRGLVAEADVDAEAVGTADDMVPWDLPWWSSVAEREEVDAVARQGAQLAVACGATAAVEVAVVVD